MKNNSKNYALIYFALLMTILIPSVSHAQWTTPEVVLPGLAIPENVSGVYVAPLIVSKVDANGNIHLVWSNQENDKARLVTSCYSNGIWSEITYISGEEPDFAVNPSLAIGTDGTLFCSWVSITDNYVVMFASKSPGQSWTTPTEISVPGYDSYSNPEICIDDQNKAHVFYNAFYIEPDDFTSYIKHYVIEQLNPVVATELSVPATSDLSKAFNPKALLDSDGLIHCLWYDTYLSGETISASVYDGESWTATVNIASGQTSTFVDESPITLVETPDKKITAVWISINPDHGQFSIHDPLTGWLPVETIEESAYHNTNGISDNWNYIHTAGCDNDFFSNSYDMLYHCYKDGVWSHEIIEAYVPNQVQGGYPELVISGDVLYCFYLRNTSAGLELVESHKTLDYITQIKEKAYSDQKLRVFPNPVSGSSKLVITNSNPGPATVVLYNNMGQVLETAQITISGKSFSGSLNGIFRKPIAGGFLIQVTTSSGSQSVKVVSR